MGAPRYFKVCLMSMIYSVAVLAATNSEPYVAASTVACFLEYQQPGVLLTKWRHPVKDLPGLSNGSNLHPWLWWWLLPRQVDLACHQEGFLGHYHIQSMSIQNLDQVERNSQVDQF